MTKGKRSFRYLVIADALRERIAGGEFGTSGLLSSEAGLSAEYRASRVTIRKALDVLRAERLVDSRQGSGWFVSSDPLRQSLDHLESIDHQLENQGITSERRILRFGFVTANAEIKAALGSDEVLEVVRINLADGEPFAVITVWCRPEFGADLSRADVESSTFQELLADHIGHATQTIGAAAADPEVAAQLQVPDGSPLLRIARVTSSAKGQDILVSEHLYPAHRTEFVVELTPADAVADPPGLRLVQ